MFLQTFYSLVIKQLSVILGGVSATCLFKIEQHDIQVIILTFLVSYTTVLNKNLIKLLQFFKSTVTQKKTNNKVHEQLILTGDLYVEGQTYFFSQEVTADDTLDLLTINLSRRNAKQ